MTCTEEDTTSVSMDYIVTIIIYGIFNEGYFEV